MIIKKLRIFLNVSARKVRFYLMFLLLKAGDVRPNILLYEDD